MFLLRHAGAVLVAGNGLAGLPTAVVSSWIRLWPAACETASAATDQALEYSTQVQRDVAASALQPTTAIIPARLLERILNKKSTCHSTAQELQVRLETLLDITQATTVEKQQAIFAKLHHVPELLNYQPDSLQAKASELQAALQQLDLSAGEAQDLICQQPAVLTFKPENVVDKLQQMSQLLNVPLATVCSLCIRNRTMVNLTPAGLGGRLKHISEMLELDVADVAKMVVQLPAVAVSSMKTLEQRVAAVRDCLQDWPLDKLGQGLLSHVAILTYSPDTIRYKWAVLNAYAHIHPATRQQLQDQQDKPTIMALWTKQTSRFQLLEYILALQHMRTYAKQHSELPAGFLVLNQNNDRFLSLVNSSYPRFWAWQDQQGDRTLSITAVEGDSGPIGGRRKRVQK